jgi:WD40 repeat protein
MPSPPLSVCDNVIFSVFSETIVVFACTVRLILSVFLLVCSVCSDFTRNPMLVPLKVLRGHGAVGSAAVNSVAFHPRQPWLVSGGADGIINLYQDL